MTRALFERELREIQDELLTMASMTGKAIVDSVDALRRRDIMRSQQIIHDDQLVNHKRFEIEEKCITVMATQQPIAADLRLLISVLYIITDLERMADHAVGIAKISQMMAEDPGAQSFGLIPEMADKSVDMLNQTLRAYIDQDADAARHISAQDDEVDGLYDQVYADCIARMIEEPENVARLTYHLWAAHNLERIADRCTNICERIVFMVTGHMEETNVSSY
jgi:phosphate transport system protein